MTIARSGTRRLWPLKFATSLPRARSITTQSVTLDEERLALRLRLGEGWKSSFSEGVSEAHSNLVLAGKLEANDGQAAAVKALAQLPDALRQARAARSQWERERARLTDVAKERAAVVSQEQRERAAAWTPSLMSRSPSTPSAPRIVGEVCWLRQGPPPGLSPAGCYLYGTVGTGKSTIMDLFCLTALQDLRARRQHFHEFALWLHQELHSMRRASSEPQMHILERLADKVSGDCDVLCLDEFAVTNVADAAILAELLRLLAVRQVAVVCTTNRPPEDLYKDGLHRERYVPELVSHIREKLLVQGVMGTDYRAAMYHNDREHEVRDSLATSPTNGDRVGVTLFEGGCAKEAQKAIADMELSPGELRISWNRQLTVPGQGNGFARFHFDDLCRRPLAAEDFLILATTFHTIFLHDIPRLSLEEHNEARRFTNLVDALYEHSVQLICHCHGRLDDVLKNIEVLQGASEDGDNFDAESLGVYESMYDDQPNFQIQIKELGSREKWQELQEQRRAEEQRAEARRLQRLNNVDAAEGGTGSGWSSAPASADLSAPDQGVAGVMVAAVGSLQESGFAARRATSRLKEMQTSTYLQGAKLRMKSMSS
eukprot:TRINITY_DN103612_c0_g1_i1.p1 TRINITY_DN103612_c0_g1~~TRINITY_DN103612_c0_g1_i1.p1  ORF type:complete len:600 (-),score=126.84 TRINITY_DN103612_c0_g1_i1:365-2164(-)